MRASDAGIDRRGSSRLGLVGQFGALSLVPLLVLGLVVGHTLRRQISSRALENATGSAQVVARLGILPLFSPRDIGDGLSPGRLRTVNDVLRSTLIGKEVAAVRVWSPQERIVYADNNSLIGSSFPNNDELEAALRGRTRSEIFDPSEGQGDADSLHLFKRYGGLVEVYVPLVFGSEEQPSGAFELYLPYRPIGTVIARDDRALNIIIAGGLLLVWLVLLPIAYRTGRVLRRQATRLSDLLSRERETVRRLRELDRMKSDFVATASHELRTPLTAIIGFSKTLRSDHVIEDHSLRGEVLDRLESQGNRLLKLVTELLEAARLQGPDGEPVSERFDLRVLAHEVVSPFEDEGRRFEFDIPENLPLVTDRGMVQQILVQLVSNAVKYSDPAAVTVIGARRGHDVIRFWVDDRGRGIDDEHRDHIFEPFWQSDSSSTRTVGGLGLGLYLVRELTTRLSGEVTVKSTKAKGTRFVVSLPLHRRSGHEMVHAPATSDHPASRDSTLAGAPTSRQS